MLTQDELDRIASCWWPRAILSTSGRPARAMSNFGFLRLRVVNRYDVAFREARSAVGAPELLKNAEECATVAEAIADCSLVVGTTAVGSRQLEHPAASSGNLALSLFANIAAGAQARGLALWFGESAAFRTTTSATATGSCAFPPARSTSR